MLRIEAGGTPSIEVRGRDKKYKWLTPQQAIEAWFDLLEVSTSPERTLHLKRMILQGTAFLDPDKVEGLFGIRVVERKEARPEGEDCFSYTIGHGVDVREFHDHLFANSQESDVPVSGAYAVYFEYFKRVPVHIGRVTKQGTVISRWGPTAHVYEHEPDLAPLSYGEPRFFLLVYLYTSGVDSP